MLLPCQSSGCFRLSRGLAEVGAFWRSSLGKAPVWAASSSHRKRQCCHLCGAQCCRAAPKISPTDNILDPKEHAILNMIITPKNKHGLIKQEIKPKASNRYPASTHWPSTIPRRVIWSSASCRSSSHEPTLGVARTIMSQK